MTPEVLYILAGVLAVLPFLYFLLQIRSTTRQTKLFSPIQNNTNVDDDNAINTDETTNSLQVAERVVKAILVKLDSFEQKQLFTRPNISLSYLAIFCDTNTKYLSAVINSEKGKDFYNYINELRVYYLKDLLTNTAYYRRVKIEVLAQKAGFSSQSKLAHNFKKVTGMSPSQYIKSLTDEG